MELYAAPQCKRLLFAAIPHGTARVVCDLSAVTVSDWTALGIMVQARLEPRGG